MRMASAGLAAGHEYRGPPVSAPLIGSGSLTRGQRENQGHRDRDRPGGHRRLHGLPGVTSSNSAREECVYGLMSAIIVVYSCCRAPKDHPTRLPSSNAVFRFSALQAFLQLTKASPH